MRTRSTWIWKLVVLGAISWGAPLLGTTAHAQPAATARYRVVFESSWSQANQPIDFPVGIAHFSPVLGVTHDASVTFWAPGQLASPGIENMSENGATSPFDAEVVAAIAAGSADQMILGEAIATPAETSQVVTIGQTHPLITLVSMLAPSPDWFVGIQSQPLFSGGDWVPGVEFDLFAYDAGTDTGTTFTAPNQEAMPHVPISLETSGSLGNGVPVGRFLITRLAAPECEIATTQASYAIGETIALSEFRILNPGAEAGTAEFKFWLQVGETEIGIFNQGADGSFVLAALDVMDLGGQPLVTVEAGFPAGAWQVGCRLLNPNTGEVYDSDVVSFQVDSEP